MKNIFLILLLPIIAACNDNSSVTKQPHTNADSSTASVSNDTGFANTDSIEVYFYADPANQNEFKRLFIADQPSVKVLVENLDGQAASMKECPHDGKMFLYRKGAVYKTVYISTADTCRYLAYAINAKPQFVRINDSVYSLIGKYKAKAR